jgi:hypothetical protein
MHVNKSRFVTEDKMNVSVSVNVSVSEGAQLYIQVFKAFTDAVPVYVWLAAPSSW